MAGLSGATLIGQGLYNESATKLHEIGQLGVDQYGNRFRYVKYGAAQTVGHLLQEPAEDTAFRSMVCQASSAIGAETVSVTLGGTAVTANLFDDGILTIELGTGLGQVFRIKSHTVQTSTTGTCTFTLDRPLKIATVVTTTQISVRKNPYNGVIEYPVTTQTGRAVGVALYTSTNNYYGWIQSGGDCAVLFDTGTNTSNEVTSISPSAAVAGSVKPSGTIGQPIIGIAAEVVSTDSTYGVVHLMID